MKAVLADVVPELVETTTARAARRGPRRDRRRHRRDVARVGRGAAGRDPRRVRRGARRVQQRRHRLRVRGPDLGAPRQRLAVVARRQRDGRRQRHQRVRADDARAGRRGPRRQHDVGQRRLHTAHQQRRLRDDEGRGHHDHRVPVGSAARDRRQGERVAALPVDPHARDAQHRHLAAGREPPRPLRPARARRRRRVATRSASTYARMEAAGLPVEFAPLVGGRRPLLRGHPSTTRSGSPSRTSSSRRRSGPGPTRRSR